MRLKMKKNNKRLLLFFFVILIIPYASLASQQSQQTKCREVQTYVNHDPRFLDPNIGKVDEYLQILASIKSLSTFTGVECPTGEEIPFVQELMVMLHNKDVEKLRALNAQCAVHHIEFHKKVKVPARFKIKMYPFPYQITFLIDLPESGCSDYINVPMHVIVDPHHTLTALEMKQLYGNDFMNLLEYPYQASIVGWILNRITTKALTDMINIGAGNEIAIISKPPFIFGEVKNEKVHPNASHYTKNFLNPMTIEFKEAAEKISYLADKYGNNDAVTTSWELGKLNQDLVLILGLETFKSNQKLYNNILFQINVTAENVEQWTKDLWSIWSVLPFHWVGEKNR